VAGLLFGLALLLLGVLFQQGGRWYKTVQGKQTQHQDALVSLSFLSKQLRHSCRESLSATYLSPDHLALGFATPFDLNGAFHSQNGQPEYQAYLIFFCRDSLDTLEYHRQAMTPTTALPPALSAAALSAACVPTGHVLSRGVEAFRMLDLDSGAVRNTASNPLRIEVEVGSERVDRVVKCYF